MESHHTNRTSRPGGLRYSKCSRFTLSMHELLAPFAPRKTDTLDLTSTIVTAPEQQRTFGPWRAGDSIDTHGDTTELGFSIAPFDSGFLGRWKTRGKCWSEVTGNSLFEACNMSMVWQFLPSGFQGATCTHKVIRSIVDGLACTSYFLFPHSRLQEHHW